MILKIAHIGVAVKNVEEVEKLYSEILGLPITGREASPEASADFFCAAMARSRLLIPARAFSTSR